VLEVRFLRLFGWEAVCPNAPTKIRLADMSVRVAFMRTPLGCKMNFLSWKTYSSTHNKT